MSVGGHCPAEVIIVGMLGQGEGDGLNREGKEGVKEDLRVIFYFHHLLPTSTFTIYPYSASARQ